MVTVIGERRGGGARVVAAAVYAEVPQLHVGLASPAPTTVHSPGVARLAAEEAERAAAAPAGLVHRLAGVLES